MANFTFRGLIAPALTAFTDNLSLNLDIIPNYAKFLANSKITGILVNGTSGEGMSMTIQERKEATEAWVKAVQSTKQHLMVQIGGVPLPHVLELARHAESVGANSLLCLPELYNKPTAPSHLVKYLQTVGAAAPKTPLLYYHMPANTNVNIHMGQFLNESVGKIPTFSGIKFTSNNLEEGVTALQANNGRYAVFLGSNQLMAAAYTLGFDSSIATTLNMLPHLGRGILEAVQQSKVDEARKLQDKLTAACAIVNRHGGWVAAMKVAMELYTPIKMGKVREPLVNIAEEQARQLRASLEKLNIGN